MRTTARRLSSAVLAALTATAATTAITTYAPSAHADEVSPTGKGIVGGALLGAEVVVITESIFNVRNEWAYVIGGSVGAIGGGIGGHFVENASSNGRAPVYMLAGGLALVIPAVVLALNATRYMPDENATEDRAPTNGGDANPGTSGGGANLTITPNGVDAGGSTNTTTTPTSGGSGGGGTTTTPPPQAPALSLFDVRGGQGLRLGIPVPTMKPMVSLSEQAQYGMKQGTELRMPVFALTF
jgi:hypothetical protein